jgi:hypothetical protein
MWERAWEESVAVAVGGYRQKVRKKLRQIILKMTIPGAWRQGIGSFFGLKIANENGS